MKFLLDMPMPQRTAAWLRANGHDAAHARDIGLAQESDEQILHRAAQEGRAVLTMDLDFPRLLSTLGASEPTVILIRMNHPTAAAIQQQLQALLAIIDRGHPTHFIAVLEEARIRLHRLPIH